MTAPLVDQVWALVETKLALISGLEGVDTADAGPAPNDHAVDETPRLQLRRLNGDPRWHLRGAEEHIIEGEIVCIAVAADMPELVKAAKQVLYANLRWNNGSTDLAVKTWLGQPEIRHETETDEEVGTVAITFFIKLRASLSDLSSVKAV